MNLMPAKSKARKIMWGAFALVVVLGTAGVFMCRYHCATGLVQKIRHLRSALEQNSIGEATGSVLAAFRLPAGESREPAPTVQVNLNGQCFSQNLSGDSFKVSVTAVSVVTSPGENATVYEKAFRYPKTMLNSKKLITSVPVDLGELINKRSQGLRNLIVAISICSDSKGTERCDYPPSFQALKLTGPYFEAASPSGRISVQFTADDKGQGCPTT
jgi:hypothetical protein